MAIIRAVIWGAIQGITEFVPISSSGHLVIIPRLLGIEAPDLTFNIALHIGTLAAVLIFFRRDIVLLFTTHKKTGILVLFGSIHILIGGMLFADKIKPFFEDPHAVGYLFIINGGILLMSRLALQREIRPQDAAVNLRRALIIGIAQVFALLPGISRSGITITTGLYAGLEKKEAYRFSFLLFIPASLLAFLYSLQEASLGMSFDITMLIGAACSAAFGIAALKILYSLLVKARFYLLGLYCIAVGLLTVFIF